MLLMLLFNSLLSEAGGGKVCQNVKMCLTVIRYAGGGKSKYIGGKDVYSTNGSESLQVWGVENGRNRITY